MTNKHAAIEIDEENAFHFIVQFAANPVESSYGNFGYDLYLPNVIRIYLGSLGISNHEAERYLPAISPSFYAAAWELCRRGILRPGISKHGLQSTDDGSAGNGYSFTPRGKEWIRQSGQYDYVPIEPGRFSRLLDKCSDKFGEGFRDRAQEAVRCYGSLAYLACCAMCGAAAESIIIAIAIAKTKDENNILKDYSSAGGRGRIENLIIGDKPNSVSSEFRIYSSLLKYWRDTAAHGKKSNITDSEAYTSLALLLRFGLFSEDNWNLFTQDI
ncbi:MAG: hypothetical protein ACYC2T_05010 [Bacillota bacterium]